MSESESYKEASRSWELHFFHIGKKKGFSDFNDIAKGKIVIDENYVKARPKQCGSWSAHI